MDSALAQYGVRGGANDFVAQFVSLANKLLGQYQFEQQLHDLLLNTLQGSTKIMSVKVLMDPLTGLPVKNQEAFIAFGSPGLIQLKEDGPGAIDSWEASLNHAKPVSHTIVHELLRAANEADNDCLYPDDVYQTTIGQLHLDKFDLLNSKNISGFFCIGQNMFLETKDAVEYHSIQTFSEMNTNAEQLAEYKSRDGGAGYAFQWGRKSSGEVYYTFSVTTSPFYGVSSRISGNWSPNSMISNRLTYSDRSKDVPGKKIFEGILVSCNPTY